MSVSAVRHIGEGLVNENFGQPGRRRWSELDADRQISLREAYGRYLDSQPATCSMDAKIEQFRRWLAGRGIDFDTV